MGGIGTGFVHHMESLWTLRRCRPRGGKTNLSIFNGKTSAILGSPTEAIESATTSRVLQSSMDPPTVGQQGADPGILVDAVAVFGTILPRAVNIGTALVANMTNIGEIEIDLRDGFSSVVGTLFRAPRGISRDDIDSSVI